MGETDGAFPAYQELDDLWHTFQGRWTMNFSPVAMGLSVADWAMHLMNSPGTWVRLGTGFADAWSRSVEARFKPDVESSDWNQEPFATLRMGFEVFSNWWEESVTTVPGMDSRHRDFFTFLGRQVLHSANPSHHLATNPELLAQTTMETGENLVRGATNFMEDAMHYGLGIRRNEPVFKVGKELAATPGEVIYRNRLMELIQYRPQTEEVFENPVLLVPAWIMKYYILDLTPEKSMVEYLVGKGHTVFVLSWKNPGYDDRETTLEDYIELGVMEAMDRVWEVCGERKIHGAGYCLGGTIFAMAASAMARDGDDRLKSLTMLAAQTDFSEAGELMLFIDDAQLQFLEDIMSFQGYLDAGQMAGAFQMLRSSDLIWARWVSRYLKGEPEPESELMSWNADATRMPSAMHSRYLRDLFLNNDFFEGRFKVKGLPVVISDIHVPVFIVATENDHVAPWNSVYKYHLSSDARTVTFVLTSGGHNAGIISYPGHPGRRYRIATVREGERYIPPGLWIHRNEAKKGSWWPDWQKWLMAASGPHVSPPAMASFSGSGGPSPAPGRYVHMA